LFPFFLKAAAAIMRFWPLFNYFLIFAFGLNPLELKIVFPVLKLH